MSIGTIESLKICQSFEYKIDNFAERNADFRSETFEMAFNSKWHLLVKPINIINDEIYVGLHLCLEASHLPLVSANITIGLCVRHNPQVFPDERHSHYREKHSSKRICFDDTDQFGWDKFMHRDNLLNGQDRFLIHGDTNLLIVFCKIDLFTPDQRSDKDVLLDGFVRDYSRLLDDSNYDHLKDLTVVLPEKNIRVHKIVLSSRSSVFAQMISDDMRGKNEAKVWVTGIDVEVFEDLLAFIYTGIAPNLRAFPEKLLIAADKHDVKDLKEICEHLAFRQLSPLIIRDVIRFCDQYNTPKVKKRVVDYIANNYELLKNMTEFDWESFVFDNKQLILQLFDTVIVKKLQ